MDIYFIEADLKLFQEVKEIVEKNLEHMRVIRCSTENILNGEVQTDSSGLLVMDLDLPGKNSISLFDEIRGKTSTPIVVLDDIKIGAGRVMKALRLGASDYLFKPIHDSRLIATIITHSKGERYAI